ncbi:MAG: exosortase [Aquisalinus sp.]|nr:exosortase [Aquisalinus sp.]
MKFSPISARSLSLSEIIAIICCVTWAVLYTPMYLSLSANAWTRPENSHAPLLLCFCVAAVFMRFRRLSKQQYREFIENVGPLEIHAGGTVFLLGILSLVIGRVEEIEVLATASQLFVAIGMVLMLGGQYLLRQLWFPLLLLIYVVVWPGWFLNTLTFPLKLWISEQAAQLLSWFGMPVAQAGVTLAVGPYKLMVADACAGLNSLFALTSLGAIYLYISKPASSLHAFILFISTIPIAIFANFLRVLILILITWHYGYDAGQSYLHDFAGYFMFFISVLALFALDGVLFHLTKVRFLFGREVVA